MKKSVSLLLSFAVLFCLPALSGCDFYNLYLLKNPDTKQEATCATNLGKISDESNQRLHQCIAACEEKGFKLETPDKVPAAGPFVEGAKPPSIPPVCSSAH